jgi:mannan endo-1,4-beta-mannosidase
VGFDLGVAVVGSVLLWALAGCSDAPNAQQPLPQFIPCPAFEADPGALLEVRDGEFFAGGDDALLPHAVNSYPLLQHIGDGDLYAVRDIFAQAIALGRPIVRTNAFLDAGSSPARLRGDDGDLLEGGLRALDELLAEAAGAGVRLLLVLTNNWEDYGGAKAVVEAVAKGEGLPKDAFWSEPRAVDAQRRYVQALASRRNSFTGVVYGDDPTIAGWDLANEARCSTPRWCDSHTLVRWSADMTDALRQAGARQPLFWGGEGGLGKHGEDLEAIALSGGVDVLTVHLYLDYTHPEVFELPGQARIDEAIRIGAALLRNRAALAERHGLALMLEEFGWDPPDGAERDRERSAVYRGWLSQAHALDLPTAPWMIGESGRVDYDGFLIGPRDGKTNDVLTCEGQRFDRCSMH